MREIIFRGQTRKLGEKVRVGDGAPIPGYWVYGGILQGKGDQSIIYAIDENGHFDDKYPVHSDTVGQFTGFCDKNGKKIFEGDILEAHYDEVYPDDATRTAVVWGEGSCGGMGWYMSSANPKTDADDAPYCDALDAFALGYNEVIGNIHDNPELLEVAHE